MNRREALDALPDVVDAVAGKVPVLMDGGIRRGSDILKASVRQANVCQLPDPRNSQSFITASRNETNFLRGGG